MKAKYILTLLGVGLFSIENTFAQETEVVIVPDYTGNFKLFMGLLALMIVLLLAVSILAKSIRTMIGSDLYNEKLLAKKAADEKSTANKKGLLGLILLVGTLMFGNDAVALSFRPEEGGGGMPWLQVENIDLILILCLNVAILILYFYLKSVFKQFKELTESVASEDEVKVETTAFKINKLLTDVVPVEEEESIILDHEFDGIRELDNNLPPWWVVLFWGTIVFAVVYMFHYHVFKTGDLQITEYNKSIANAEKETKEYLSKMAMNVDENTATRMIDAKDLAAGKIIFEGNCVVCHRENGQGDIGPNLTDDYWLYSNDIKDVFKVIKDGTSKGMPEHTSKLNPIQIQQVSSYVLDLPFAEGKEAEGVKMEK